MKRGYDGRRISKARRSPCQVRLDRLVFGATGRMPSRLLEIAGYRVVADFRPHRQGKIASYGRVRKFRSVGSSSQILSQYEPLVPWVDPWRFTMIADDVRGLAPEEVEAVLVHCANHKVTLVELAVDFAEDAGVDRKFVLRHGVFGKSRRQSNPAGQDYVRYGTRASSKLVRCYRKHELGSFRVELESHGQLLRRYSISQVGRLGSFASQLYPDHIRFVGFRWHKLRLYLTRRFGPAGQRIYEEVENRAALSLRLATRFLSEQGVPNTHRFLRPLAINDEIQSALDEWATRFSGSRAAPTEYQMSG
jgi:hypothetical protein